MIPAVAHFVWLGRDLPWCYALAMRSAAIRGGLERVVLHPCDDLSSSPHSRDLAAVPGFEALRLDPGALLDALPRAASLRALYERLPLPSSKANLLRVGILALEGGVYLDTDTVTVASLRPLLRRGGAFCGEERVALPRRAAVRPEEFPARETLVVHWYASVSTRKVVPRLSPEHVRRHAGTEAWSALVLPLL